MPGSFISPALNEGVIIVFFHCVGKIHVRIQRLNRKRNCGRRILAVVLNSAEDNPLISEFLCFSIFLIKSLSSAVVMSLKANFSSGIREFGGLLGIFVLFILIFWVSEGDNGLMFDCSFGATEQKYALKMFAVSVFDPSSWDTGSFSIQLSLVFFFFGSPQTLLSFVQKFFGFNLFYTKATRVYSFLAQLQISTTLFLNFLAYSQSLGFLLILAISNVSSRFIISLNISEVNQVARAGRFLCSTSG